MIFHSSKIFGGHHFARAYHNLWLESGKRPDAVCALLCITPATLTRYFRPDSKPPAAMMRLLWLEGTES
jgi:hypothetical protein